VLIDIGDALLGSRPCCIIFCGGHTLDPSMKIVNETTWGAKREDAAGEAGETCSSSYYFPGFLSSEDGHVTTWAKEGSTYGISSYCSNSTDLSVRTANTLSHK
jgi:hypothetical protein